MHLTEEIYKFLESLSDKERFFLCGALINDLVEGNKMELEKLIEKFNKTNSLHNISYRRKN